MKDCKFLSTALFLGVLLTVPTTLSARAILDADLNFFTPEVDDIELENRVLDAQPGDRASISEFFDGGSDIVMEYVSGGGDTSPGGMSGAVATSQIIITDWVASGSADASFERLATDAYWSGLNDGSFSYGGSVEAEAEVRDTFNIVGNGNITFTYDLSGLLSGSVTERFGTSPGNTFFDYADIETTFLAEFDKNGSSLDALELRSWENPNPGSTLFYLEQIDETVSLSLDVSDGDIIDYRAWAQTIIDFDSSFDLTRSRGRGDFGSTAELVSVFVSDGVSLFSDSGFDYLSVNSSPTDPDTGGGSGDGAFEVPLPATFWLMLSGLGMLAAARRAG